MTRKDACNVIIGTLRFQSVKQTAFFLRACGQEMDRIVSGPLLERHRSKGVHKHSPLMPAVSPWGGPTIISWPSSFLSTGEKLCGVPHTNAWWKYGLSSVSCRSLSGAALPLTIRAEGYGPKAEQGVSCHRFPAQSAHPSSCHPASRPCVSL